MKLRKAVKKFYEVFLWIFSDEVITGETKVNFRSSTPEDGRNTNQCDFLKQSNYCIYRIEETNK